MAAVEHIFNEISPLKPVEKFQLIDKILNSLNPSNKKIEDIWAKEAEDRIEAYDRELISTVKEDDNL